MSRQVGRILPADRHETPPGYRVVVSWILDNGRALRARKINRTDDGQLPFLDMEGQRQGVG